MAGTDEEAASEHLERDNPPVSHGGSRRDDELKQPAKPIVAPPASTQAIIPELDDFGLPIRTYIRPPPEMGEGDSQGQSGSDTTRQEKKELAKPEETQDESIAPEPQVVAKSPDNDEANEEDVQDATSKLTSPPCPSSPNVEEPQTPRPPPSKKETTTDVGSEVQKPEDVSQMMALATPKAIQPAGDQETYTATEQREHPLIESQTDRAIGHRRYESTTSAASGIVMSEFSHQNLSGQKEEETAGDDAEESWQTMPAYAPYDIYDDDNNLIAREHNPSDDESYGYAGLGGAGKGYTRVMLDEDAESATSLDENTKYLFNETNGTSMVEDDHQRDAVSQMQATKDLLTEGQRIAYVGLTRLELSLMVKEIEELPATHRTKREIQTAAEAIKMWSQKMMIRLYSHMDINSAEQVMIEQLSEHGVMPSDLTPVLIANARVKNPMAESQRNSVSGDSTRRFSSPPVPEDEVAYPPPPYESLDGVNMPEVKMPSELPTTSKIDIDLRWTVLCDLFLVLIADSIYDSRSRVLLERVGNSLDIPWMDICRFEKRVTDALEMQQNAEKENWNEGEHMETRRKMALRKRYLMMGLATVGGGLVIGLSAGLLAPVIGAGLAAGFTTIGVSGTSSFLAGAGGAALITSSAATSGGIIGVKAADRRTGAVRTFEYRPLHNNKRVNLIVTVSGWMTGKVDDVRLPYSTVDPIMGDIYSVLWEPEMLTSMGDTINILATEALTQGLQQLLGSTILVSLMAAIQLPVVLTKLSYLIDNPWAVSLDRATMAGLILADSLIDRNLGTRPVTLVGYSLGSRVIYSCLQELSRKGAYGLVQNVFIFGSPIVVKKDEYMRARTVVAGRFVNGYSGNDWILGYLFRLTNGGIRRIGGLAAVEEVPGLENMDVSEFIVGHMDYRVAMPRLLRECGWLVESDEFTEIEDPDPEDHQKRQRELISEIEHARKELEKEGQKESTKSGIGGFFSKKRRAQRQEWEIYEDSAGGRAAGGASPSRTEDELGNNHGVLFDVEAIRAELAKEKLEVKEIEGTLPPMKLDYSANATSPGPAPLPSMPASPQPATPRETLRRTTLKRDSVRDPKGANGSISSRSASQDLRASLDKTPTLPPAPVSGGSYFPQPAPAPPYGAPYGGFGDHDDDGGNDIQMTFDTSFEHPSSSSYIPYMMATTTTSSSSVPLPMDSQPPMTATRPGFKSAQTVPNITLADPWADDDDDFGKEEEEISMTFA